ncbi:uncharacterized protein [Dysidea avara]|uniref:uncharacterized protein isoform X2 n=1 Tax=Dysidea avara TaxID=196820 RepID=UPI00331F6BE2
MSRGNLFMISDESQWVKWLDNYDKAISTVQKSKKKKDLKQLDNWFQNELPKTLKEHKYLKHEELVKLMTWKLSRGKFRPRLMELVSNNKPELVESVTRKGLETLPNLEKSIKILTQLQGVGPATASAIVTAASPDIASFMADESYLAVSPGKIAYTLPSYLDYNKQLSIKAAELNKTVQYIGQYTRWS